ncbi:MAG TPA: ATP--guanido phosphotransferase [Candidatus Krumholzibacteria bacterium]|nr:ATP--guanido phosphotransferase [Candidatus Krumholzibacteria bacterium]HPD71701.1 ATP--guanido phosphotransferase [Candidatus Krumholzibacteria bacterium]HRY41366.1 ATP--guanido phosphotransferase [Candidatus Krumholzibacteria bacterium]
MFREGEWHAPARWLDGSGEDADVVVSTRVRLARNLAGIRFPHRDGETQLNRQRRQLVERLQRCPSFAESWSFDLAVMDDLERRALLEMHVASPDLLRDPEGRGLVVSRDRTHAVMINEEDHLRLQVFSSGFAPQAACDDALLCDSELEAELDFAYSDEFGYLTACPTNVGTGCRLSVLIHLPGLVLGGEIEKILNSLRQLQFAVRGLYGEGSAVQGALFQISNLATLGRSEQDLTAEFARHVAKVVQYERMALERLHRRDPVVMADLAYRALALLQHARVMTSQEAFDRLSQVRMGVVLEILPRIAMGRLNVALVQHQAAHLQLRAEQRLSPAQRGRARAEFLRELLRDV